MARSAPPGVQKSYLGKAKRLSVREVEGGSSWGSFFDNIPWTHRAAAERSGGICGESLKATESVAAC